MIDDNITFTLKAGDHRDKDEYLAKNVANSLVYTKGPLSKSSLTQNCLSLTPSLRKWLCSPLQWSSSITRT
jgi:hypothetical protein